MARSERFELPTLGIEIRCSIQLSYERKVCPDSRLPRRLPPGGRPGPGFMSAAVSQALREQPDCEQPEHEQSRQQRVGADSVAGNAEIVVGEVGEPGSGRPRQGPGGGGGSEFCDTHGTPMRRPRRGRNPCAVFPGPACKAAPVLATKIKQGSLTCCA